MSKKVLLYSTLTLFVVAVVYVTVTLSTGRTAFFGRALTPGLINPENSYVFASPLTAKADGQDKIRVTIFALDGQGKGSPNKVVTLNCKEQTLCQNAGMVFSSVQPNTDSLGQAIFDVSSPMAGKYELQASVTGLQIPQTVSVIFQ